MNTDKNNTSLVKKLLMKVLWKIVNVLLKIVIPVFAFTVLGYVIGIFVGRSSFDSVVDAAVIPAALSLAGGFILFINKYLHPAMGPFSVLLFCVALLFGASIGGTALRKEIQQEKVEHFWRCSKVEQEINRLRVELTLPPLPSKIFCG